MSKVAVSFTIQAKKDDVFNKRELIFFCHSELCAARKRDEESLEGYVCHQPKIRR